MKLNEVFTMLDSLKPHAFSKEVLTSWLNEVEGTVHTDVMLLSSADYIPYVYDRDKECELLAKEPYTKIYYTYLSAMVDFANGEYEKYENTMQLFNQFFSEYMRWYSTRINPSNGKAKYDGYYLSAYAIAVAHGFLGDEAAWLRSLRGEKGDGWVVKGYFETFEELRMAELELSQGDTYAVGKSGEYSYYSYDFNQKDNEESKGWICQGEFSPVIAKRYRDEAESAKDKAVKAQIAAEATQTVAKKYANNANECYLYSQSYSVGGSGIREGENTDNAKYYYEQAKRSEENSKASEEKALEYKNNAKLSEDNAKISEEKVEERYTELANKPFANSLVTKKAGESEIVIDDISPIEHDMSVRIISNSTSNNIPLYPYDTDTELIAGCDYTITDDGVYEIEGVSNGYAPATLIKTLTLPAGEYTFWAKGYDSNLGVMFVRGAEEPDGSNIICHFMNYNPITPGNSPVTATLGDEVISIWFTPTVETGVSYSWNIKPYISKGSEIEPDVSNAEIIVSDKDNNETTYYTDKNGLVSAKSIYPKTVIKADEKLELEVIYNKDLDGILQEHQAQIEEAKSAINKNNQTTTENLIVLENLVWEVEGRTSANESIIEGIKASIINNSYEHNKFQTAIDKLDIEYSSMKKSIGDNAENIDLLLKKHDDMSKEILDLHSKVNAFPSQQYVEQKDEILKAALYKDIAETYATKEEVGKTKGEIEILSEEVESEIRAVGEQVKSTIPDDYTELSAKVNNTSNALKGKVTGSIVSMKDVSPVEHKMDVEVNSKNLLNFGLTEDKTETKNGLTETYKANNTIVLNGTPTTNTSFGLSFTNPIPITKGETYTISMNVDAAQRDFYLLIRETSEIYYNTFSTVNFIAQTDTLITIGIVCMANKTFDNLVIKPQLEKGTVATDYTPYVDNIEDVKLYRTGKNLFDSSILLKAKGFSKTDDGYYTGSATQLHYAFDQSAGSVGSLYNDFKPNTQYTVSFVSRNSSKNELTAFFRFRYSDGSVDENRAYISSTTDTSKEYTSQSGKTVVGLYMSYNNPDTVFLKNIQLEEGTATNYEPYIVPVEVNKDEVISLYPTTTLYTDTAGVSLEVEYNKDINKVYADQQKRIETLEALLLDTTTN